MIFAIFPIEQLKERRKPIPASVDIHNLGLSICENQIVGKLIADIIKPSANRNPVIHKQQQQQSSQSTFNPSGIIEQNNKVIVEKLNELITLNKSTLKENKTLKDSIVTLESKLEKSITSNNRPQQQIKALEKTVKVSQTNPTTWSATTIILVNFQIQSSPT